jgi:hypothetical protein
VPFESCDVWEKFKPDVERFIRTWKEFPPGVFCDLCVLSCVEKATKTILEMFTGLPQCQVWFDTYPGLGMDLGAQQHLSRNCELGAFQVNFTTRAYFHRKDWLLKLVRERLQHGPMLYGMSSSWEGGKFHICTRGHAYDTDDFNLYPHTIESRDQGVFFECGDGSLTDWFDGLRYPSSMVASFNGPGSRNKFRQGDQSNMLVWDRHTLLWADASPEEKERLTKMAYPEM